MLRKPYFAFWYRNIFVPKYNYIIFHPIIEGATLLEGFDDEDADNNVLKKGKLSYRIDEELFYKINSSSTTARQHSHGL